MIWRSRSNSCVHLQRKDSLCVHHHCVCIITVCASSLCVYLCSSSLCVHHHCVYVCMMITAWVSEHDLAFKIKQLRAFADKGQSVCVSSLCVYVCASSLCLHHHHHHHCVCIITVCPSSLCVHRHCVCIITVCVHHHCVYVCVYDDHSMGE